MTQTNLLLMQAKAGNPVAIATLINRRINTQGVTAKVTRKNHHLQILFESVEYVPSKKKATRYLQKALAKLDPVALTKVQFYGRRADMETAAWAEVIDLVNLAAPTPRFSVSLKQDRFSDYAATKSSDSDFIQTTSVISDGFAPSAVLYEPIETEDVLDIEDLPDTEDLPDIEDPEALLQAFQQPSLGRLWLRWQIANLKGGLALMLALWLVNSLILFILSPLLQPYLGLALASQLLLGLICSLLLGGWLIGNSQAKVLKPYLPNLRQWRWTTFFGFGLGCALATGVQFSGPLLATLPMLTALPLSPFLMVILSTASGMIWGSMIGFWQWLTLRKIAKSGAWILWSLLAGGISVAIALIGSEAAAAFIAQQLHQFGWISRSGLAHTRALVYGILILALIWLSYHAISGIKLAQILKGVPLAPRQSSSQDAKPTP